MPILYHGSTQRIENPQILHTKFYKDFGAGFYCTLIKEQAVRWATRYGRGALNEYEVINYKDLRVLQFKEMTEEWLNFIAACRTGQEHDYDIVEGPMANDTIFNYVQDFVSGRIIRSAFWELARFKHPTHQICFATSRALSRLRFMDCVEIDDEK